MDSILVNYFRQVTCLLKNSLPSSVMQFTRKLKRYEGVGKNQGSFLSQMVETGDVESKLYQRLARLRAVCFKGFEGKKQLQI